MIYDDLIPQLANFKSLDEIPEQLLFDLVDATLTTGMVLAGRVKGAENDKLSESMTDIKTVIVQHIDQHINELKKDDA